MFKINYIEDKVLALNYIELKNSNGDSNAKIYLNLSGSLQELKLQKFNNKCSAYFVETSKGTLLIN